MQVDHLFWGWYNNCNTSGTRALPASTYACILRHKVAAAAPAITSLCHSQWRWDGQCGQPLAGRMREVLSLEKRVSMDTQDMKSLCAPFYWHIIVDNSLLWSFVFLESACNAGDLGSVPGLGRSPRGGHGNLLPVFLPGKSPWTEESGGLQSMESKELGTTDQLSTVQHSCSLTLNSEKEWLNSCVCVLFIDFF